MVETSADSATKRFARLSAVAVGGVLVAVAVWVALLDLTAGSLLRLLVVLIAVAVGLGGARLAGRLAASAFAPYNVAEVAVEGPITRDGLGALPTQPGGTPADDVVEQVERADADENVGGLVVRLNTPGGEIVPSDDIRIAVQRFDGPTVAYMTDTCASGGYWIASGCDRLVARQGTLVGSIGVIGSRVNASGLAERLGLSYERFTAGKYKDAGAALKELTADERAYLQTIVDDLYDDFVSRVAVGRDIDEAAIRDTEARVYVAADALDLGLVDEIGTHEDVESALAEELDTGVTVREFAPSRRLMSRLRGGAQSLAFAFGAGAASAVAGRDRDGVELELR